MAILDSLEAQIYPAPVKLCHGDVGKKLDANDILPRGNTLSRIGNFFLRGSCLTRGFSDGLYMPLMAVVLARYWWIIATEVADRNSLDSSNNSLLYQCALHSIELVSPKPV